MTTFFISAAAILETLRMVVLTRDMKELAIEKGEAPGKWVMGTLLIWAGVELTIVGGWFFVYGWNLSMIIAVFIAIVMARVIFYFYKKNLNEKTMGSFEDKIDEIGKED